MEKKKDSVEELFSELPEAMSLEELMEIKGGYPPPPECPAEGGTTKGCASNAWVGTHGG